MVFIAVFFLFVFKGIKVMAKYLVEVTRVPVLSLLDKVLQWILNT